MLYNLFVLGSEGELYHVVVFFLYPNQYLKDKL